MPLYQNSVLKKYLKQQDKEAVAKAFKKFAKYFHDSKIQENIRSSKEEEYQGIFLTELFSKILGYTIKPNANFDLVAEYKNEKNRKKADGAILKDNQALGVIELKGTNTKDLEKVRQQAFDYKANQTGCIYVITSNFAKIRFYINNAVDFEEFDLFTLNQERFELLYLCLAKDNLLSNVPLKIKEASVQEEEAITKKFYKDYSTFKRELFRDLVKLNMKNEVFRTELNNADTDKGTKNIKQALFKKSQKLIDRFLFIFFAEDRGLLPPNSTVKILDQWNKLKELDEHVPLYSRYKKYFNYLDTGRKGTDKTAEIFAYNGGLFKPDTILNSLLISDHLLYKHTKDLQAYDFESQVDVNILGHIFENSLNEIESVNAEIEGTDFDKQTTKRKKDGIFYTPKYITKYIVDNTVGKLCNKKKAELGVIEEEYLKSRKGRSKSKLKELLGGLEAYRKWLLQITILDPACGSGAFLNQALDFLIKEHQYIDELQTNLLGGGFVFPDIENTVLENNIFGVDLNEESVEIAKLSLWLRTAQPRRKLNDLSSNIKCGNSLIDSKTIAGDKAFKWEERFPEIFANGGFDIVVGNPPWGAELNKVEKDYLKIKFPTIDSSTPNSYTYFMGLCYQLTDNMGLVIPDSYLLKDFEKTRKLFTDGIDNLAWYQNSSMPDELKPFAQVDHDVIAFTFFKKNTYKTLNYSLNIYADGNLKESSFKRAKKDIIEAKYFSVYNLLLDDNTINIKKKLIVYETMGSEAQVHEGIHSGNCRDKLFIKNKIRGDEKPLYYGGRNGDIINNYYSQMDGWHVDYRKDVINKEIGDYASLRDENIFKLPKVYITRTGNPFKCFIDNNNYASNNFFSLQLKDLEKNSYELLAVYVCILNSKLSQFYIRNFIAPRIGSSFVETKIIHLLKLPLPHNYDLKSKEYLKIVNDTVEQRKLLNEKVVIFLNYIQSQQAFDKLTTKMKKWHELEFGDFIKELNKAIKKAGAEKLSKIDEMEWMDVFETKKAEAQTLKAEIDKTDKEIDQMVYELYGLTDEEIQIVENS